MKAVRATPERGFDVWTELWRLAQPADIVGWTSTLGIVFFGSSAGCSSRRCPRRATAPWRAWASGRMSARSARPVVLSLFCLPGALMSLRFPAFLALVSLLVVPVAADEKVDHDFNWKLRREAAERPKVMQTLHVLTDVHGPRLTGSPNYKAAGRLGREATHRVGPGERTPGALGLRPSRAGATNASRRFVVSPYTDTLTVEVVAWTPGTNGAVRGQAVQIVLAGAARRRRRWPRSSSARRRTSKARLCWWARRPWSRGVRAARQAPRRCGTEDAVRPEQPQPQPDVAADDGGGRRTAGPAAGPGAPDRQPGRREARRVPRRQRRAGPRERRAAASTARCAPSTTAPSTSPRPCRPS